MQGKAWIDTDAGVDDALGLLIALADASCAVLGVSCVFGNAGVKQVAANVARVLACCDRDRSVPVHVGADEPLVRPCKDRPTWYGRDGLGDVPMARPRAQDVTCGPSSVPAAVALVQCASEHEGQLTVIALGPLTNVALALKLDPSLPTRLHQLVVMGGDAGVDEPEFNFASDPEAAAIVMEKFSAASASGHPASLVLVDYGVCKRHPVPWHYLVDVDTQKGRFWSSVSTEAAASARAGSPHVHATGWPLADPLAVAVALQPGLVKASRRVQCRVEVRSDELAGLSVVRSVAPSVSRSGVQLVTAVDDAAYASLVLQCFN